MEKLNGRVENIVRLIVNNNYEIPKGDKQNDLLKEEKLKQDKRPLEGIATDLITNHFLKQNSTIAKYIKLITETMTLALEKYSEFKNLGDNKLHFIFKGGNVLRVLAKEFMFELPGGAA